MRRPRNLLPLLPALLALALAPALAAQDDPCEGLLADPAKLAEVLPAVPRYASTYVLVTSGDRVASVDDPALRDLNVLAAADSAAETIAARLGLAHVQPVPSGGDAGKIIEDVLAGQADAGLLWAPLAGLGILELDWNYDLTLRTAGEPSPPPAAWAATGEAASSACAESIADTLSSYGVVPAEKLVKLDIRDLLGIPAPPRDRAQAVEGAALFAVHCARCHGPDAVPSPDSLAPVSLLVSTARFSYPGFLYIVLNGRSQNGMPGFRGTLTRDDIQRIYQFARERSHGATDLSAGVEGGK